MTVPTLAEALDRAPADHVALDDGQRTVAYGELGALLHAERCLLAGYGERHAVLADNGVAWAIADLALHLERLPAVPIPGYFTDWQVLHVLDDAGIDCIHTDDTARLRRVLPRWRIAGTSPQTGLTMFRRPRELEARPALPPGTTKVTYTSGSTASPKGVCLGADDLETVAASLAGAAASLGVERHLCLLPLATLLENVGGVYAPLMSHATCLLPHSGTTGMSYAGPDVPLLLGCVASSAPGSLILVPELLKLLVVAAGRGWRAPPTLRFVAVGGASVPLDLLEAAEAAGLPVYEGYGLSECASVVTLNTPEGRRRGSAGRPLPHARVRIGDDGQVMVSGVTMRGYLGGEPREPGAEWATGDLGEFDADGYLHVRGRLRNLYITSYGRNVAPEWVEREIAQSPAVRHVMVHGEAKPWAVALVVPAAPDVPTEAIARAVAAANRRLPDYAQVRRWARVEEPFSLANGLLTANGRLRRRDVAGRHASLIDSLYRDELAG
ncbi:MAG: AMP-binding protein [Steroidobacteraceae bacterium]